MTFFFNGGVEAPYEGEDRKVIPSPKDVPTYDLKPQMSAPEVADECKARIESGKYDVIILNFANCDMVGHTVYRPHHQPGAVCGHRLRRCEAARGRLPGRYCPHHAALYRPAGTLGDDR